jgi:hypothetical protein
MANKGKNMPWQIGLRQSKDIILIDDLHKLFINILLTWRKVYVIIKHNYPIIASINAASFARSIPEMYVQV